MPVEMRAHANVGPGDHGRYSFPNCELAYVDVTGLEVAGYDQPVTLTLSCFPVGMSARMSLADGTPITEDTVLFAEIIEALLRDKAAKDKIHSTQ